MVTANIGVGGAFLLSESPEPVGTELEITLLVPGHEQLQIKAEVRWAGGGAASASPTQGPGDPGGAGMGLKFAPLDVEALLTLQNYFSTLGS